MVTRVLGIKELQYVSLLPNENSPPPNKTVKSTLTTKY